MRLASAFLLIVAVGCGGAPGAAPTSPPGTEPAQPARAESGGSGGYRVLLELPTAAWRAGVAITGNARLERLEDGLQISGSGGGPIGFEYREVGGRRHLSAVWDASCGVHTLTRDAPINEPLGKSGGWSNDDPDADFYRDFLQAPDVRLPAGVWDVSAVAMFYEGRECEGAEHQIRATIRITVNP
jgi:hypothetical protein